VVRDSHLLFVQTCARSSEPGRFPTKRSPAREPPFQAPEFALPAPDGNNRDDPVRRSLGPIVSTSWCGDSAANVSCKVANGASPIDRRLTIQHPYRIEAVVHYTTTVSTLARSVAIGNRWVQISCLHPMSNRNMVQGETPPLLPCVGVRYRLLYFIPSPYKIRLGNGLRPNRSVRESRFVRYSARSRRVSIPLRALDPPFADLCPSGRLIPDMPEPPSASMYDPP
jgi:hypothetical protein